MYDDSRGGQGDGGRCYMVSTQLGSQLKGHQERILLWFSLKLREKHQRWGLCEGTQSSSLGSFLNSHLTRSFPDTQDQTSALHNHFRIAQTLLFRVHHTTPALQISECFLRFPSASTQSRPLPGEISKLGLIFSHVFPSPHHNRLRNSIRPLMPQIHI